jgi:hypothetical protein
MTDSDSGGSSSTRLSVFKGGVNDSYPHIRIKLILLFKQKGLHFLFERDSEANPTLFIGEEYERKIIAASNIIVQSLGRNSCPSLKNFWRVPLKCWKPWTTVIEEQLLLILLSPNEIQTKVLSE